MENSNFNKNYDEMGSERNVDDGRLSSCSVVIERVPSVENLVLRSKSLDTAEQGSRRGSMESLLRGARARDLSESDSDASQMSVESGGSRTSNTNPNPNPNPNPDIRQWLKRRRDIDEEDITSLPAARRGRGRPPSSGKYVGLAKAQAELNAAKAAQAEKDAEDEMAKEARKKKEKAEAVLNRNLSPAAISDGNECKELEVLVQESVDTILNVARTSGKLKGTYVKALKDAAEIIKVSVAEMRARTVPEEVVRLENANARMMKELQELRKEMAALRSERAQAAPPPTNQPDMESFMQAAMVQFGTMVNARFAGLEERLLPEKRVRPPLAADLRRERAAALDANLEEAAMSEPSPQAPLSTPKPTKGKGKGKGKAASVEAGPSVVADVSAPQPEKPQLWTEVVKRAGRSKARKEVRSAKATAAPSKVAQAAKPTAATRPQAAKPKAVKLRSHRTAAVVVTLLPGAEEKGLSYGKVLAEARSRMDFKAMEMPPLVMRKAATGARVIEVPGSERLEKADTLASKLREVLKDVEGVVSVSRPVTTADLRVSGLDDSVTSAELLESLAGAGGCSALDIKAGEIRSGPGGMGTAFVRCPVTAVKKLMANGGRLQVGWVAARIQILDARPRRCYRCLELGHVRAQCQSEVDRSDDCYRCGQTGHKASGCSAAPHCTLCAAVGKTADHLSGGKACAKPPSKTGVRKGKAATKAVSQPTSSQKEQPERMEET